MKPALSERHNTNKQKMEWEGTRKQTDFNSGADPPAIESITKVEFITDPDTISTERPIQLFKDYHMPKRNTYHSRGDFVWAKQEKNELRKSIGENWFP